MDRGGGGFEGTFPLEDDAHREKKPAVVRELDANSGGAPPSMRITVHVLDKKVTVSCGTGTQRIRWLGHVGIARYDEKDLQGWKTLGVPLSVSRLSGEELDMGGVIRETLRDKDHVVVAPSLKPAESKSATYAGNTSKPRS